MVGWTALIAGIIGISFGILLTITGPKGILENTLVYSVLDKFINIIRSVPFIILLALVVPLTRIIVGTSIGTIAAIVPLSIGVFPFYARQVQNALVEVDSGIIEAAQASGSSNFDLIFGVYLKEGTSELIRVSIVTLIGVIDFTAMAGAIGGGGLGNLAISLGYDRFENDITIAATLIILVMVLVTQTIGDYFVRRTTH
ncbi:abc superfamily atp binding cassette transporter, membrane protein [Paucilactobacillus oligofermentans DSM 15707 = LMG 22743]|uniref:Abc superfamily atp binding cassette transporter, membrane protein n=2 Tax=Paucilactobacillus oligofermentans TaxID=293371 RepID=A0A0R1RSA9_9LACO|nr:abc superfamily atp binding cassette transporter, membrane protein [Paucilactobacillus oligofermentans DSM 15707 = LMG 22743]